MSTKKEMTSKPPQLFTWEIIVRPLTHVEGDTFFECKQDGMILMPEGDDCLVGLKELKAISEFLICAHEALKKL
jgi:hypothetical protein